jgi:hypothetical protein
VINISFAGDDFSPPVNIKISSPKTTWLGKVGSGNYRLETPDSHARKNMMPLPAVRELMAKGDLPFVQFGKKAYVLERVTQNDAASDIVWPPARFLLDDEQ